MRDVCMFLPHSQLKMLRCVRVLGKLPITMQGTEGFKVLVDEGMREAHRTLRLDALRFQVWFKDRGDLRLVWLPFEQMQKYLLVTESCRDEWVKEQGF